VQSSDEGALDPLTRFTRVAPDDEARGCAEHSGGGKTEGGDEAIVERRGGATDPVGAEAKRVQRFEY
jgi:hypothetical protein